MWCGSTPPTLSDGDITVRPLREADVPAIVAACQDPEIPRWTRVPSPYTVEDARQFLAIAATEAAAGDGVALAVADAADKLVGTVGLMGVDGTTGEIGYWIAAEARGKGVATRAVVLLRDWAHRELGLRTIDVLPHRDNAPSQHVARRAGFSDTGDDRAVCRTCRPAGGRATWSSAGVRSGSGESGAGLATLRQYGRRHGRHGLVLHRQHGAASAAAPLPRRRRARSRDAAVRDRGARARQRVARRLRRRRARPSDRRRADPAHAAPREGRERHAAARARPRPLLPAAQRGRGAAPRRHRRASSRRSRPTRGSRRPARSCSTTTGAARRPRGASRRRRRRS